MILFSPIESPITYPINPCTDDNPPIGDNVPMNIDCSTDLDNTANPKHDTTNAPTDNLNDNPANHLTDDLNPLPIDKLINRLPVDNNPQSINTDPTIKNPPDPGIHVPALSSKSDYNVDKFDSNVNHNPSFPTIDNPGCMSDSSPTIKGTDMHTVSTYVVALNSCGMLFHQKKGQTQTTRSWAGSFHCQSPLGSCKANGT